MTAQIFYRPDNAAAHRDGAVLSEVRNHIGYLTLNRVGEGNALNLPMLRTLQQQTDAWAADTRVRAVVIMAAGDGVFCSGDDVRSLYASTAPDDDNARTFILEQHALNLSLQHYRKPVVALMDGQVLGSGLGLAQTANLRVVTERATLALPEAGIGLFPDMGASYFLPRIPGEIGIYLGISGTAIEAADALYCRLADWYLDSSRLLTLRERLDRIVWSDYPLKDLQGVLARLGSQYLPRAPLDTRRAAIDHFFALADVPAMIEQLQQVTIGDSELWARQTARSMNERSPLAMAVTLELLRRGRHMRLEECLAMELHLSEQWLGRRDLLAEVRAHVLDRRHTARWTGTEPAQLARHQVQDFFL